MFKRLSLPLFAMYIAIIIALFLYSYTQVDLSLTFSRASFFQTVEKWFQHIGYFQRPLSTEIFLIILLFLFFFYGFFLLMTFKNKLSYKQFWKITIITSAILFFSYNAFSYDIFNY